MQKISLLASITLGLCITGPVAYAVNWQWLEHTPAQAFSEQDWDLFRNNVRSALNTLPDGAASDWANAESGNAGNVTIISSDSSDSNYCRTVEISNRTPQRSATNKTVLCRMDDGGWKIRK